jgi:uncharacterized protein YkwD
MSGWRFGGWLVLCCGLFAFSATAVASSAVAPNGQTSWQDTGQRVPSVVYDQMISEPARMTLALLNQYRAQKGLPPVQLDEQMTQVAYEQAALMAQTDMMEHDISGDFAARLVRNNVLNVYAGENIGRNIRTAEKMFDWWVHSPIHEHNITNPNVTRLGFAVAYSPATGKPYWSMALASSPIR